MFLGLEKLNVYVYLIGKSNFIVACMWTNWNNPLLNCGQIMEIVDLERHIAFPEFTYQEYPSEYCY